MDTHYDEIKVLGALSRGSELAFKQIYDQYAPAVYRVANRYLQSGELAEDLVQELFTTLWFKREELSHVQQFRFYLFTMAKNLALRYLKKIAREALVNKEFSDRQAMAVTDDKTEQYEALLQRVVEQLPPQQKQIFHLAKVEKMSHEAIAQQLNISPSTVNNHMVAALRFIRQQVPRYASSLACLVIALVHRL